MTLEQEAPTAASPRVRGWAGGVGCVVAIAVGALVVAVSWDEDGVAVASSAMRTFLVLWLVAGALTVIAAAGLVKVAPVVRLTVVGLALGAALASTAWDELALSGWRQLWLSVPLLLGQAPFLARRHTG